MSAQIPVHIWTMVDVVLAGDPFAKYMLLQLLRRIRCSMLNTAPKQICKVSAEPEEDQEAERDKRPKDNAISPLLTSYPTHEIVNPR